MFDRRPALVIGAGLVVGLTALSHSLNLLLIPLLLLGLERPATRWTLLFSVGLGFLLAPPPLASIQDRQYVRGEATVVGVPRTTPTGTVANIEVAGRVWRAFPPDCPQLALGDRLRLEGLGRPLREANEQYLLLHGVTGRLDLRRLEVLEPGPNVWRWADDWRRSFAAFTSRWMTPEAAALTQALCFDLNGELDPATTDRLRRTGTIHVVSASGLHVFLLAYGLMFALGWLPVPRSLQLAVLVGILLLYAGATGLNPPVVRAALMSLAGFGAYLFMRESDPLSALGISAVAYLLWQPRQVLDPGFQLSFVTVGAMALFLQPRDGRHHLVREKFEDLARASWVAWLASVPLVAYHFGTLSLSALPANLLIALPVSAAVISALVAHLAGWLVPSLGVGLLSLVAGPMTQWVLIVVEWLSRFSASSIDLPGFSGYWLPLIYGALLLTWRQRIVHPE